jgi:hypothetical protein
MDRKGICPLTTRQIIDEYFIENRTRILELAAFLDRLDRSKDQVPGSDDFRMRTLNRALQVLASDASGKIDQIQLLLSDPTTEPKAKLDAKSASGAWNPAALPAEVA